MNLLIAFGRDTFSNPFVRTLADGLSRQGIHGPLHKKLHLAYMVLYNQDNNIFLLFQLLHLFSLYQLVYHIWHNDLYKNYHERKLIFLLEFSLFFLNHQYFECKYILLYF